ncbi:MAG: hypothetical protein K0U79_02485 [Gammaproteobacteria bacterium]|nr:hypothetical protein [Gammaproteobacteria bacterium]
MPSFLFMRCRRALPRAALAHSGLQSLLGCSSGAFAQADKWLCHDAFDEYLYTSEAAWVTRADANRLQDCQRNAIDRGIWWAVLGLNQ